MNLREFIDRYHELTRIFLRKFCEDNQDRNIAFSPFSILSLLSILADATGSSTRREIQELLCGDLCHPDFVELLMAVRQELTRKPGSDELFDIWDPDHRQIVDQDKNLDTANAVIVKEEYSDQIRPEFRKYLADLYDGILLFTPGLKEAVKKRTSGSVREMLPLLEDIVDSDSILAMINTVFFHAMWQYPYEDEDVEEGIFHNADHTDSRVNMLPNGVDHYVETDEVIGFTKSFQQCDYTFMAMLPREEGPDALRKLLEHVDFYDLMHRQRFAIVHSKLPEFSFSFRQNLNPMMQSLGIRKAFTPEADFSAISLAPLVVDQMIHQAKIEVDRNGARAAAATTLVCYGAGCPEGVKYVIIDRPFVFAILNQKLKIPVFVGVVNHIESIR